MITRIKLAWSYLMLSLVRHIATQAHLAQANEDWIQKHSKELHRAKAIAWLQNPELVNNLDYLKSIVNKGQS